MTSIRSPITLSSCVSYFDGHGWQVWIEQHGPKQTWWLSYGDACHLSFSSLLGLMRWWKANAIRVALVYASVEDGFALYRSADPTLSRSARAWALSQGRSDLSTDLSNAHTPVFLYLQGLFQVDWKKSAVQHAAVVHRNSDELYFSLLARRIISFERRQIADFTDLAVQFTTPKRL